MAVHYEAGTLANVFGTLGAVCWSIQLLPQIILNHRRRSTTGLKPSFMLLWATAGCPLAVYNIVNNFNIALIIQPQILTALSLVTWGQCRVYGERKWSSLRLLLTLTPLVLLFAALQTALILLLRLGLNHNIVWPTQLIGVLGGVLLCAGVGCEYVEIWRAGGVEGVSFLFCGIDAMGDVCGAVSVLTQTPRDYVALSAYTAEFAFWTGIFGCGVWFRLIPWMCERSSTMRRLRDGLGRRGRGGTAGCTGRQTDAHLDIAGADVGREAEVGNESESEDVTTDVQEEPRSMSVFRTASRRSEGSLRQRQRQANRDGHAESAAAEGEEGIV